VLCKEPTSAPGGVFYVSTYGYVKGKQLKNYSFLYVGAFGCCSNVLTSVQLCITFSAGRVWLAGQRQNSSTPFMWNPYASDAVAVNYTNWDNGSPTSSGAENCLMMNAITGYWSNTLCNATEVYILCEFGN
jgi:hypothetical protein